MFSMEELGLAVDSRPFRSARVSFALALGASTSGRAPRRHSKVHRNDFDRARRPVLGRVRRSSTTPSKAASSLGQFGQGRPSASLTLISLPPHTDLTVAFAPLRHPQLGRDWDNGCCGPERPRPPRARLSGPLLRTTFATGHPFSVSSGQAYPRAATPGASRPVRTGAVENYALGYRFRAPPSRHDRTRCSARP